MITGWATIVRDGRRTRWIRSFRFLSTTQADLSTRSRLVASEFSNGWACRLRLISDAEEIMTVMSEEFTNNWDDREHRRNATF